MAHSANSESCLVVLGGPRPGIHHSRPFISWSKNAKPFPMVVIFRTLEQANQVLSIQSFVAGVKKEDLNDVADHIKQSEAVGDVLKGHKTFYPVAYGIRDTTIYLDWNTFEPLLTGHNPRFMKSRTFTESLVYMVLKGDVPMTKQDSGTSNKSKVSKASRKGKQKSQPWDDNVPVPLYQDDPPQEAMQGISATQACMLDGALEGLGFDNSPVAFPCMELVEDQHPSTPLLCLTPPSSPQLPPSHPDFTPVFQYTHNLIRVTSFVPMAGTPVQHDTAPLPTLGNMAMAYLNANGYDLPSILCITSSYQTSRSVDDFTLDLAFEGLPVTECQYIWDIIKLEQ